MSFFYFIKNSVERHGRFDIANILKEVTNEVRFINFCLFEYGNFSSGAYIMISIVWKVRSRSQKILCLVLVKLQKNCGLEESD